MDSPARPTDPSSQQHIGVLGAGYVGLVTGACLAAMGHCVTVRDIDPVKVALLHDGQVPFHEPGLAELIKENLERLTFTMSMRQLLSSSDLIFVAVGTPPTPSGDADLSSVVRALEELSEAGAERKPTVVMKSTVPVGSGQRFRAYLDSVGLPNVGYVSNPEFLREGSAVHDFLHPDRVVIGEFDSAHGDRVAALYEDLGVPIVRTSVSSAEMIKYASNAFLATKISFINEIANVCEEVGADVDVVARGMGLDPRIGPGFLRAGIGYGGSCFPKDVAALKQLAGNSGYHFQLLTSVIEVNELQKRAVVNKLKRHLGGLERKEIALLGLAFKPGTDDMREAASIVLASRLHAEGAHVRAYDPIVTVDGLLNGTQICPDVDSTFEGADAVVLVTEWPQLVQLDWTAMKERMRQPIVIDGRNALDPAAMRAAGYTYEGIGRR